MKLTYDVTCRIVNNVTPFAGVWIEIGNIINHKRTDLSLPLRECGLKCSTRHQKQERLLSLPLRECGLKSKAKGGKPQDKNVTPFAGVWIEICLFALLLYAGKWSLPLRECGLKYINNFTGAHIAGHSLCGSVD